MPCWAADKVKTLLSQSGEVICLCYLVAQTLVVTCFIWKESEPSDLTFGHGKGWEKNIKGKEVGNSNLFQFFFSLKSCVNSLWRPKAQVLSSMFLYANLPQTELKQNIPRLNRIYIKMPNNSASPLSESGGRMMCLIYLMFAFHLFQGLIF